MQMVKKVYSANDDEEAQRIMDVLKEDQMATRDRENCGEPGTCTVLCYEKYSKATWICIIMAVFNQLDGANVLNFYSNTIFTEVFEGDGDQSAVIGSVLVGVAQIFGVMLAPAIGSRVGMKKIFVAGQFAQSVGFGLVTLFSATNHDYALIGSILIFLVVF